jgi:molybdopterin-biosynthesis enzyme MoeA-like protein
MPGCTRCQLAGLLDHHAAAQAKNEQLAVKAAAISEEELEAVRAEAAQRVAAAERKVPAAAPPGAQLLRFPVHIPLEATFW